MFSQNSKTGILSDKRWKENCLEYKALPVGFANANFSGMLGNPYLTGIKTPKYQQSAPKPQSADEMAVNSAKFLKGSRTANASMLLREYQKQADKYEPPKVRINNPIDETQLLYQTLERYGRESELFDYESREDFLKSVRKGLSGPIVRNQLVMNRGDQIVRQTIGVSQETQAGFGFLSNYEAEFNKRNIDDQKRIMARMQTQLRDERHISINDYLPAKAKQIEMQQRFAELLRIADVRGANINLDTIFGIPTSTQLKPSQSEAGTSTAGTSTEMSGAPTVQKQTSGTQTTLTIKSGKSKATESSA